jgi:hypothetical protein
MANPEPVAQVLIAEGPSGLAGFKVISNVCSGFSAFLDPCVRPGREGPYGAMVEGSGLPDRARPESPSRAVLLAGGNGFRPRLIRGEIRREVL